MLWFVLASYIHMRALLDVYESLLAELVWTTLTFVYGISEIFGWRRHGPFRHFETQWYFGQVLVLSF